MTLFRRTVKETWWAVLLFGGLLLFLVEFPWPWVVLAVAGFYGLMLGLSLLLERKQRQEEV
jgi:membrane-bound ClpP family serine protease